MLGHFVDNSVAFPLERYVLDVFPWGQDLDYESRISRRGHRVSDRCLAWVAIVALFYSP